jgi:hypothetical protein
MDRGPLYPVALVRLGFKWRRVIFGMYNHIERWFGTLKARTKRFYNNSRKQHNNPKYKDAHRNIHSRYNTLLKTKTWQHRREQASLNETFRSKLCEYVAMTSEACIEGLNRRELWSMHQRDAWTGGLFSSTDQQM